MSNRVVKLVKCQATVTISSVFVCINEKKLAGGSSLSWKLSSPVNDGFCGFASNVSMHDY